MDEHFASIIKRDGTKYGGDYKATIREKFVLD
jgi:hypothetical protein